jgi:tRNA-modifying protein YgfZ
MSTLSSNLAAINGALRLNDWGLICASGEDRASFLHGQLTQRATDLPAHQHLLAGYCSPKGRLLASFVMWAAQDEHWLACSADLLPATLKRLQMFVMRARCRLSDASADIQIHGLAGLEALQWVQSQCAAPLLEPGARADLLPGASGGAGGQALRLADVQGVPRALLLSSAATATLPLPALAQADWDWLEVHSAVPRIVAATVDAFVPQMVNLELLGGVNFQKGCYPGQEVVARSQYRGTLKRRAYLLQASGQPAPAPGTDVFHSEDLEQPCGKVILSAARGGQAAVLAELKIAATLSGGLHMGAATGAAWALQALPYAIPAEQG